MRVVILGAGVTGVTTACSLASRGFEVTVVERAEAPAAGATHANGGQLSWSFTDSLAKPSFLPEIPGLLLGRDPAVCVRPAWRPPFVGWGLGFLRQCTHSRARQNTIALMETAARSALALDETVRRTGIRFARRTTGKLVLLPPGADLDAAEATRDLKRRHGCDTEVLTLAEARRLEPALAGFEADYAAAVYAAGDEVGDAQEFTAALGRWLEEHHGTRFRLRETVRSLIDDGRTVHGVRTDRGELEADAVVVCLGAWSGPFLARAGVRAPIYPVRGYSVTLPPGNGAPRVSVTDMKRRILYCPLDGRMRIAGFADFVGFDARRDRKRISTLLEIARQVAPRAADYTVEQSSPWAGSRPMTPDGRPLVGATARPGLFMNCGHGMLGWTLASATAEDVADAVCAGIRAGTARAPSASDRSGR